MADNMTDFDRENEIVRLMETNRKLEATNRQLKSGNDTMRMVAKGYERQIEQLENTIDRLQEAIVNQALLLGCAMEWGQDDEADED